MAFINRLSKLWPQPIVKDGSVRAKNHESLSKSQKLLSDFDIMYTVRGMPYLLPLGVRTLRKLESIVRKKMNLIGAQEISLPLLTHSQLLEKTKRLDMDVLWRVKDRGDVSYVLSPTHEEAVTDLIASQRNLPFTLLPLRFYQIGTKFRDELLSKNGVLRCREFTMKDLYCFDTSEDNALVTYKTITQNYCQLFNELCIPFECIQGYSGDIGGSLSHEFHVLSDIGEDNLIFCNECNAAQNACDSEDTKNCFQCKSKDLLIKKGIEVGHTFMLGHRYAEPLNAMFKNAVMKDELLQMSCYGLGLTRIIATAVEIMSLETEIRWPFQIAPYKISIIIPKAGSKQELALTFSVESLYSKINESFDDDVIIDDRAGLTIGRRILTCKQIGIPLIVILGKTVAEDPPRAEVIDVTSGTMDVMYVSDLVPYLKSKAEKLADYKKLDGCSKRVSI